jgi:hypothetical protein
MSEKTFTKHPALLRSIPLFAGLTEQELTKIGALAQVRQYATRTVVVNQGNSALALFQGHLTHLTIKSRQKLSDGFQTFVFDYLRATGYKLEFNWVKLMAASGTTGTNLQNFKDSIKGALIRLKDEGMIGEFVCSRTGFRVYGPAEQEG